MILAAYNSGLYHLFFLLHIVSVLVAFAPAVVHAVMGAQFEGVGEEEGKTFARFAYQNGHRIYGPALVLIGFFGLAMVFTSKTHGVQVFEFSQAWVSLAFLVWLGIVGIVFGVILPNTKKHSEGDLAAIKNVAMGGQIATVLLLIVLYLMIWKPGF